MATPPDPVWVRRLAPLVLDGEPLRCQLARRFGATLLATALLGGFMVFFQAIFTGFGAWRLGLGPVVGLSLGVAWLWIHYARLRGAVTHYGAIHPHHEAGVDHRPT